ncbi:MAG: TonB family protein [Bacteroidetes bacterium]|nr:TonB family protein [Bacteroidota bacterium]
MKNPNFYLESTIDDIVFEDRNQAYGAYQLRKDSSRFLRISLFIGLFLASAVSAFSLSKKHPEMLTKDIVVKVDVVNLEPKLPKVEEVLPPPPQEQVVQQATQAFNEMVATADPNVLIDDVPTIDDLQNRVIDNYTIDNPVIGETPIINTVTSEPVIKKEDYILFPSQMPEYVGGTMAMMKYLGETIEYPRHARDNGIEGIVYVSFIINTDGTISDATAVRGIGYGCDEEAVRAIMSMKKWIPGKQNASPVRVKTTIPIKFELED